ncbi:hypothetical protein ACQ4M3_37265 [Leptolyngbya sp. AN03gr2]|uniref:hypothetical protein n=1 Tax=unclassified Leptolyngbya TaxID=2650499 RepID=UPI003D310D56
MMSFIILQLHCHADALDRQVLDWAQRYGYIGSNIIHIDGLSYRADRLRTVAELLTLP